MNLFKVAMLGVRLTGIAVSSFALLFGVSPVVDQIGKGGESHKETRVEANTMTVTETLVKRSFNPLLLAPAGAGLTLGLVLILGSRPIARILILGLDEQQAVQPPICTEPRDFGCGENRTPLTRGR